MKKAILVIIIIVVGICSSVGTYGYFYSNFNGIQISDSILLNEVINSCETHDKEDFFFISGNHDGEEHDRGYSQMIWENLIYPETSYSIYIGNVQIIMNGIEMNTNNKYNDEWLLNEINTSYNTIIARHHNDFPIERLPDNVFLLMHGHTHFKGNDGRIKLTDGKIILDISSIDFCHSGNSGHSYLLEMNNNSKIINIKDFNHSSNEWNIFYSVTMEKVFSYQENSIKLIFCSDLHIGNIECGTMFNFNWAKKCFKDFDSFPEWKYCFVLGDISDGGSLYFLKRR